MVLKEKNPFDKETLRTALQRLTKYLKPNSVIGQEAPEVRKQLAINLYFKSLLSICPEDLLPELLKSGAASMDSPMRSQTDKFHPEDALYPLNNDLSLTQWNPKSQTSLSHLLHHPGDLYCCFVTAKKINHRFKSVDASGALVSDKPKSLVN